MKIPLDNNNTLVAGPRYDIYCDVGKKTNRDLGESAFGICWTKTEPLNVTTCRTICMHVCHNNVRFKSPTQRTMATQGPTLTVAPTFLSSARIRLKNWTLFTRKPVVWNSMATARLSFIVSILWKWSYHYIPQNRSHPRSIAHKVLLRCHVTSLPSPSWERIC